MSSDQPLTGFIMRLHNLSDAQHAQLNIALWRISISRIDVLNDPFELLGANKVLEVIEAHSNAIADRETIRAKRKRAELLIDVWRTQESSRRKGHL